MQIAAMYNGGGNRIAFRTYNGDSQQIWNQWCEFYHSRNKPTATDVEALPLIGGTLTGPLTVKTTGQAVIIQASVKDSNYYFFGRKFDGTNHFYIGQASNNTDSISFMNYLTGTGIILANGAVNVTGQVIPTLYNNFDARYQAKGNYATVGASYTKSESDNKYQPKGNYATVGQSYTKAESDGRYVQGFQRGAQASMTMDGGLAEAPAGCVLTGGNGNEGNQVGVALYRPLQFLRGGVWVTIGG
jgi:hypothetical protein